jgi:hypothetical protein
MTIEYPGHLLKTRRQVLWQSVGFLLILLPLLSWRFTIERPVVSLALAALVFVPLAIAHRGWRFLEEQEKAHATPTPEMAFVFETIAVLPLAMGAMLAVLLIEM